MTPFDFLTDAFLQHLEKLGLQVVRKPFRMLLLQLTEDIPEEPEVRILIAVDVADFLRGPRHLLISAQVIEEREAGVEVDAFEDIVRHHDADEVVLIRVIQELVILLADEGVPLQEMLIFLPLVENRVPLFRRADRVQHIAVALRVDALLERLDVEAEVHFARCDVARDVRGLQRIKEHEEAQNLVIRVPLRLLEIRVVLHVLREIDFLRHPEVIHRLAVPVGDPRVLMVIEVVQVRRVSAHDLNRADISIPLGVEQRFFLEHFFSSLHQDEQDSHSSTSSDLLRM